MLINKRQIKTLITGLRLAIGYEENFIDCHRFNGLKQKEDHTR
jgi:hypothetical protein